MEADFGEVDEPEIPQEPEFDEEVGGGEDPDQHIQDGENVVMSGDQNADAGKQSAVAALAAKKIPNDQRTTTPFLTKYERARVLGTRAQQIRCVKT